MSIQHRPGPRQNVHRGRRVVGRHAGVRSAGSDCPDPDGPFDIDPTDDTDNDDVDYLKSKRRARSPNVGSDGTSFTNPAAPIGAQRQAAMFNASKGRV